MKAQNKKRGVSRRAKRGRTAQALHVATRKTSSDEAGRPVSSQRLPSPALADPQQCRAKLIVMAVLVSLFVWAYWPTLAQLVRAWNREPDYSHGFFVVPLALFFLWARRDGFPGLADGIAWFGLVLLGASVAMRVVAAKYYLDPVDGWSILLWFAGVTWLLGGWRVVRWASPSILFLWFMVPLPYRAERLVSYPLQRIATKLSCWTLQSLGQPAIAEGNTILLGEHHLEVEQACSGLRIFVGIVALAFAYVILVRRAWWEKALLLAFVVPIALIANASRIVTTGLLMQLVSGEAGGKLVHDLAGWAMILFAAALFGMALWYLGKLFPEVEPVDVRSVVRMEKGTKRAEE